MRKNLTIAKMLTTMAQEPAAAGPISPRFVDTLKEYVFVEGMQPAVNKYAPGYDLIPN